MVPYNLHIKPTQTNRNKRKLIIKTVEFICLEKGSLRQFLRYCIYLAYFLIIKILNTHRVFAVYACQRVRRFKSGIFSWSIRIRVILNLNHISYLSKMKSFIT